MAETQYVHDDNGQEVTQEDLNLLGECALTDDRVLADLFRLTPYDGADVVKRILPFGVDSVLAGGSFATVIGATGGVDIMPFRAIVGSRTAVAADAKANWRDIRSAIHIGTGQLHTHLDLDSDSGGGARFDLIYAKVTVDVATSVSRKVKDPATLVVSTQNVDSRVATTVEVLATKGTEGSDAKPALAADAAGVYYVGLAYVRVAAGFVSGATAVQPDDVWEWVDCADIAEATGASSCRVADGNNDPTGAVETRSPWTIAGVRPPAHMPSTMVGKESLLIALDLTTGSESHNSGDVVDASRDWRMRLFKYMAYAVAAGSTPSFAWEGAATPLVPGEDGVEGTAICHGMGQSIDSAGRYACYLTPAKMSALAVASSVTLSVDAFGRLVLGIGGAPNAKVFVWLDASAQYANGTV